MFDSLPRSFTLAVAATLALTAIALDPSALRAQQVEAPAGAAKTAAAPAAAAPAPIGGRGYSYDASGRRDPFSALDHASDPRANNGKLNGLAGLMINEATVKGVVKSRGRMLAMVQAPDNKTYIVRASDRLLDGEVRAVTAEAVVFVQNVNDPLSPVRQREIRKPLRIVEEGK